MTEDQKKAYRLFNSGIKPNFSTFIDGETITAGYGEIDSAGSFQYPLEVNQETLKIIDTQSLLRKMFLEEAHKNNWAIPPSSEIMESNHYWLKRNPKNPKPNQEVEYIIAQWDPYYLCWCRSNQISKTNSHPDNFSPLLSLLRSCEVVKKIDHPEQDKHDVFLIMTESLPSPEDRLNGLAWDDMRFVRVNGNPVPFASEEAARDSVYMTFGDSSGKTVWKLSQV